MSSDEVAAAVAAGRVTRCPPAYCAAVAGAEPLELPPPPVDETDWRKQPFRFRRPRSLSGAQVREIRRLRAEGVCMATLAQRFKVSRVTIWKELNRR